jgi:hypothetical protein
MEIVRSTRSFDDLEDWLEGFRCDKGFEMRKGRLNALLNPKNFENQSRLAKFRAVNSQLWYICEAISSLSVQKPIVEYGADLILKNIGKTHDQWDRGVKKETVFQFLKLIRRFNVPNKKSIHMHPDHLRDFLTNLLRIYPPDQNTRQENIDIINTVWALGVHLHFLLTSRGWKGHELVIEKLIEETRKSPDPFRVDYYGGSLAIHMAAAGDLSEALAKRRATKLTK